MHYINPFCVNFCYRMIVVTMYPTILMMRNKIPTAIRNFPLVLSKMSILSVECTIPNIRMANPANAISISTLCMISVVFVIILFLSLIIKHTFALGCKVCVYFCVNIKKNSYRIRTVTVSFLVIPSAVILRI